MKNIPLFLILTTLIIFISCKNQEENKRDKITFEVPIDSIENSIKTMNNLMDKLESKNNINYFFDNNDNFYINSIQLGKIETIDIYKLSVFNKLTNQEKKKFILNVQYLKYNYVSSSFKEKPSKCYLYSYREIDDKSFNMNRDIYLKVKDKNYETLFAQRKIIDTKGNIVLIGSR